MNNMIEDAKNFNNNSQFKDLSPKRRIVLFSLGTVLFIIISIIFNLIGIKILDILLLFIMDIAGLFIVSYKYQVVNMFKNERKLQTITYLASKGICLIFIFIFYTSLRFILTLAYVLMYIFYFCYYFSYIPFLSQKTGKFFDKITPFKKKNDNPLIEA